MNWTALAIKVLLIIAAVLAALVVLWVQVKASARERQAVAEAGQLGTRIEVNGVGIHVKVDGSGPPLILLHGASGNLRDFDPLVPRLAAHFTVVRFDRPGLGFSDLPERYDTLWRNSAPTPAEQARFLSDAYQSLGLGPAVLVGQSYGGAVALAWTLERPEDVAALVPVSAVSNRWTGPLDTIYTVNSHPLGAALVVPLITAFATPAAIDRVLGNIFAPQGPPPGYGLMIGVDLSLRRSSLITNARQIYLLRDAVTEMALRYHTITVPTEILHGDADTIVPMEVHSIPLSTQLPNAAFTRLEGIGHMPHHAAPDEVIAAIHRAALRAGLHDSESLGRVTP